MARPFTPMRYLRPRALLLLALARHGGSYVGISLPKLAREMCCSTTSASGYIKAAHEDGLVVRVNRWIKGMDIKLTEAGWLEVAALQQFVEATR